MITNIQVQISPTEKRWSAVHLPNDYDILKTPCALLIFTNGVGESGNNTEADLIKMFSIGPLKFAQEGNSMVFINPLTNILTRFIVVGIQGFTNVVNGIAYPWAAYPQHIYYAIENDLKKRYNILPEAIYITGLSAGGGETINMVSREPFASSIAAAVPMSPASAGVDLNVTLKYKIKLWSFCGTADYPYIQNARGYTNILNGLKSGSAKLTEYAGGHGGWNMFYDPSYKEAVGGRIVNIYEWMLINMKLAVESEETTSTTTTSTSTVEEETSTTTSTTTENTSSTTTTSTTIIELSTTSTTTTQTTKKSSSSTLNLQIEDIHTTSSNITLDGSKSTGWKTVWYELVSRPVNALPYFNSKPYNSPVWSMSGLVPGTYVIRMTGENSIGVRQTRDVTITVEPNVSTSTTTSTSTLPIKTIKSVTIEWSDGSIQKL